MSFFSDILFFPIKTRSIRDKAGSYSPVKEALERQCWLNAQYSKRGCLDIVGIPSEMEVDVLEEKVVVIFEKMRCNIPTERMKLATGSLKNPIVIVKFSQRKECQKVWDV